MFLCFTYSVGITIEPINKVHFQRRIQLMISNLQTYPKVRAQMGIAHSERAWSQTAGALLTTATAGNSLQHPKQQFHWCQQTTVQQEEDL